MDHVREFREVFRGTQKKLEQISQEQAVLKDLSISQTHTLVEIGRQPDLTINALANLLKKDKSTMSRIVQSLEKKDWVRIEENPIDARSKYIQLTESGNEKFQAIEASMDQLFAQLVGKFDENELKQMINSLNMLSNACDLL